MIDLIRGDCLIELAKLADASVDFVFADPPYNVGKDYGDFKDDLPEDEYAEWMRLVIAECNRVSKFGMAFFVGSKRTRLFWNMMPEARCIIAEKGAIATPNGDMYFRQWSSLLVTRTPLERCYDRWIGIRMPGEGYYFRETRYPHPGQTAEQLVKRVLRFFTKEGETVLDPFSGTGTTAAACLAMNRSSIGYEISGDYHAIAEKRIADAQKQPALVMA